jgi:sortase A
MTIPIQRAAVGVMLRGLQAAERPPFAAGAILLAWPLFVVVESAFAQWAGEREIARAAQSSGETIVERKRPKPANRTLTKAGSVLGRFQAPGDKLSNVLLEGTSDRTLDSSIGHIEGTSLLGESGKIGIAGRLNTHFRRLGWIGRGDELNLSRPEGEYRNVVEWVLWFAPKDLEVLAPEHGPAVTPVASFPFEYVGSAPFRFIIRALPDASTHARLPAAHTAGAEKPAEE